MMIEETQPLDMNIDAKETLPMFVEDSVSMSAEDSAFVPPTQDDSHLAVYTTGDEVATTEKPEAPAASSGDGEVAVETPGLEESTRKIRKLPPVPVFKPSVPDDSDVPQWKWNQ